MRLRFFCRVLGGSCMKWFLSLISLWLLILPLEGVKQVILVSLEDKNKQADRAFITWKLDTFHSPISPELRKILIPEAREFLVNQSQLPFTEYLGKDQLKQKVRQVSKDFAEKFNWLSFPGQINVNYKSLSKR